jgi:hypothetical protein
MDPGDRRPSQNKPAVGTSEPHRSLQSTGSRHGTPAAQLGLKPPCVRRTMFCQLAITIVAPTRAQL